MNFSVAIAAAALKQTYERDWEIAKISDLFKIVW